MQRHVLTYRSVPTPDPLDTFNPTRCTASPEVFQDLDTTIPSLEPPASLASDSNTQDLSDAVSEIYEWLSLIRLQSPRVSSADTIDPYLSRYEVPGEPGQQSAAKLCTITWQGFLPPKFARQLLVDTILALPSHEWFSLSMSGFSKTMLGDAAEVTFLRPPKGPGEFMLWEIKSHE